MIRPGRLGTAAVDILNADAFGLEMALQNRNGALRLRCPTHIDIECRKTRFRPGMH